MKFICDEMLGRLAKWLRILGFDTLYFKSIADPELLRISLQENRILITKDRHLSGRYMLPTYIIIKDDDYLFQLNQIFHELDISTETIALFSRCVECNAPIESVKKYLIKDKVPPFVYAHHSSFYTCPSCHKIFWEGTHRDNAIRKLEEMNLIKKKE